MIFYIFCALASLLALSFFLPVHFIISYKNEVTVSFRFLFIKKKIPIDVSGSPKGFSAAFGELSKIKDKTLDIYSKLNGKIKIAKLKIHAEIDMSDAFLLPLLWGAVSAIVGTLVGVLDSHIGVNPKKSDIRAECAFLDTPLRISGEIILKSSLLHLLFASTYTFFKAIFKGGKNGRKQAK